MHGEAELSDGQPAELPDDAPDDVDQHLLFDVEADWRELWRGMPSYDHEDLQPWQSVVVHFKSMRDREAFARLVGQTLTVKTKSIWHPKAEIGTAADKVWTTNAPVTPRYPVYIISKGRADTRLTAKAFEWTKVPYHIVIEPQEYDAYAAVVDPAKILVLPFQNLGLGSIPARNWVWEHAIGTGAKRHWIFDDNVSGFCRFQDNLKVEVDSGVLHRAIEDWVDRYENVAMAAFNYDYFAPRKQGAKIRPITLNTRCYSGILLSNDVAHRWRGRYNEDTDLSLQLLKDGWCTALFNAFLMYKKPTLTMKGGNATELYQGVDAAQEEWAAHVARCKLGCRLDGGEGATWCDEGVGILSRDGRWLMAYSLWQQHPDVTTIERKWQRWQHQVDYRAFRPEMGRNVLRLRPDVTIDDHAFELTLEAMPASESGHNGQGHVGSQARRAPEVRPAAPSALGFLAGLAARPEQPAPPARTEAKAEAQAEPPRPATAEPGSLPCPPDAELSRGSALELKTDLEARGHRIVVRDGQLFVSETTRLTNEDKVAIVRFKAELIAMASEELKHEEHVTEAPPSPSDEDASSRTPQPQVEGRADGIGLASEDEGTTARTESASLFIEARPAQTISEFLGGLPDRADWRPDDPPSLDGIDDVVLNFATDGLDWRGGHRPVGVTVSTMDGALTRFLPFRFAGGNLDEEAVKRWAREQLRGKRITNSKTKFDLHMAREWGVDLEEQGCTFSDVQHTAALLDGRRKRFGIDALAKDYLPGEPFIERVSEGQHPEYHAADAAERELFTARLVGLLLDKMRPQIEAQELQRVQALEDAVIPAVVDMERNGCPLDLELLDQMHREVHAEHQRLLQEVSDEAGFAFEHTAKGWARLIDKLGLPMPENFDERALAQFDHPLIRKGFLASQHAQLASKTFDAYKANVVDGVLYYDINQIKGDDGGTVSGRFSIGYVQQVPNHDNHHVVFGLGGVDDCTHALCRWFPRRLFRAGPDALGVLEADAMQIEFRLLVHHTMNAALLKAYADDPRMSFHKTMWAMLKTYKPDMSYTHTKSYNFAAQYGARSIKLAVMMGFITEREGEEIRAAKRWNDPRLTLIHEIEAAYKRAHPEANQLLDRAAHLAKPECDDYCKRNDTLHRQFKHRGYVRTLLGRRSRFDSSYRTYIALNHVIQGTGADVMKQKIVELRQARKATGFRMRLTIHDAVFGDRLLPDTQARVDEVLNRQSFSELKVPILWDSGAGESWAGCKG